MNTCIKAKKCWTVSKGKHVGIQRFPCSYWNTCLKRVNIKFNWSWAVCICVLTNVLQFYILRSVKVSQIQSSKYKIIVSFANLSNRKVHSICNTIFFYFRQADQNNSSIVSISNPLQYDENSCGLPNPYRVLFRINLANLFLKGENLGVT